MSNRSPYPPDLKLPTGLEVMEQFFLRDSGHLSTQSRVLYVSASPSWNSTSLGPCHPITIPYHTQLQPISLQTQPRVHLVQLFQDPGRPLGVHFAPLYTLEKYAMLDDSTMVVSLACTT